MTNRTGAENTETGRAVLEALAKAEHSPGSKTHLTSLSRALNVHKKTVQKHLRRMDPLVSETIMDDQSSVWTLTPAGWDAVGQKPPLWRAV